MSSHAHSHGAAHDWSDKEYVSEWIKKDSGREAERRALLDAMMQATGFGRDAEVTVLDIGGGNGRVSDAVLRALPKARITLQDFSQPMLDQSAQRFAAQASQMRYVLADLTEAGWEGKLGGRFDLAVSGIAIHNLQDLKTITPVYRAIRSVLKPGGSFLDCDHFDRCGGLEENKQALLQAGFSRVELVGPEGHPSTLKAIV